MARSGSIARVTIGLFNVLVGALAVWGGGQEVVYYWNEEPLSVGVGAAGAFVGALFALSGVAIWRRRPEAQTLGLAAAGGTILVHGAGVMLGIIGMPGLLFGVAYPALVMAWLARPGSGLGRRVDTEPPRSDRGRDGGMLRRVKAQAEGRPGRPVHVNVPVTRSRP
jgi:hypothetical protein